ncbi:hypothetical protein C8J56DRAFT_900886 [Mycena floridula]|nr:hypothetical protein C8J56DRAFT_900886 [Mycena floridula]
MSIAWAQETLATYGSGLLSDISTYSGLTPAFYGIARVGEVAVPTLDSFDSSIYVKRKDLNTIKDRNDLEVTNIFIPCTKTEIHGENIFWARWDDNYDPESAFND